MLKLRKGFTLIELLIVVVIIGILAAIAIPKFSKTREKAYYSAMKSDLKNLQAAQEIYYSGHNYNYAPGVTEPGLDFSSSTGVTVTVDGDQSGWNAYATHKAFADAVTRACEVYYGSGAKAVPTKTIAVQGGAVTCVGE